MKKRIKSILVITERFYPEEFIVNNLVKEWVTRGYRIEVLTQAPSYPYGKIYPSYKNKLFQIMQWEGIKIYRFLTIPGYHKSLLLKILNYINFIFWGCLIGFLIGFKYERIFIYQTGPLTLALPGVCIKKIYHKELSIWTQDLWPDTVYAYGFRQTVFLTVFLDKLVRFIYKNCTNVFVSCEGFIPKLQRYIPDKKIHYFPNWPSIAQYNRKKRCFLSDKFNFTFAGNIGKVQNLENVIMGFGLVSQRENNAQLNIIGDGSHVEYLKNMVKEKEIRNVMFWGRKSLTDMPYYFNASDVLIISLKASPIFELTVPSKFQMYLLAQKPIFCIMKGEVKTLVEKYKLGLTASPDNLQEIKDGFKGFTQMKKANIRYFSLHSRDLLKKKFNQADIINKMSSVFFISKGNKV